MLLVVTPASNIRWHPEDREAYEKAKSAFIEQVMTEAERWAWDVSWTVLDDAP
jgi:hypothetical protein